MTITSASIRKKQERIEQESDLDTSLDYGTSSSNELTDIEERFESETEKKNFVKGLTHDADYVLVRFETSKTFKHYMGKVLEITIHHSLVPM